MWTAYLLALAQFQECSMTKLPASSMVKLTHSEHGFASRMLMMGPQPMLWVQVWTSTSFGGPLHRQAQGLLDLVTDGPNEWCANSPP